MHIPTMAPVARLFVLKLTATAAHSGMMVMMARLKHRLVFRKAFAFPAVVMGIGNGFGSRSASCIWCGCWSWFWVSGLLAGS